jgi:hypothetical protein
VFSGQDLYPLRCSRLKVCESLSQLIARLGASPARLSAGLAMIHVVPAALVATRIACDGAHAADCRDERGIPQHLALSHRADIRAGSVKSDAVSHLRDVALSQASGGTDFASLEALMACLDALEKVSRRILQGGVRLLML